LHIYEDQPSDVERFARWARTALTMAGSSFIVAVNALLLKRLRLPGVVTGPLPAAPAATEG